MGLNESFIQSYGNRTNREYIGKFYLVLCKWGQRNQIGDFFKIIWSSYYMLLWRSGKLMESAIYLDPTWLLNGLMKASNNKRSMRWASFCIRRVLEEAQELSNTAQVVMWGMRVQIELKYRRRNKLLIIIFSRNIQCCEEDGRIS